MLRMANLLPTYLKCGSHVADSLEPEVEKADQVNVGHYVNSDWMCDDCFRQTEGFGMASSADVSPNTPRADEADVI
jgi:hypothetical protein